MKALLAEPRSSAWFTGLILIGVGLFCLLLPSWLGAEEVQEADHTAARVVVLDITGEITAGTVSLLERAVEVAEASEATHLLIELHTPGGLLQATEQITRTLIDTPVTTIVYVHRPSGWAFSAGTFILLAADVAASHPTASLGAATPITSGGEAVEDKLVNASASWLASLSERAGRSGEALAELVTEASTLSGAEALERGLIDLTATDRADLYTQLKITNYEEIVVDKTVTDHILGFVSLPYLVPLLLSLGAIGLFFMFRTGDIESLGIVGVLFLLLGLWGMGAIQLSVLGVTLLVAGISLIVTELIISPGFGIVGTVGVVCLLFGIMTFANEPLYPNYFTQTLFYVVLGICGGLLLIMIVLGRLSVAAMLAPIRAGREALYGKSILITEAIPASGNGAVVVTGERYPARGVQGETFSAGELATVVRIEGNTILVKR